MQACHELSKLPKTTALRSLNFKRTTPGSIGPALGNYTMRSQGPLDPSHPAVRLPQQVVYRTFPQHTVPGFKLRAFPQAMLRVPETTWPEPPFGPAPPRGPGSRRVNVSFLTIVGKKSVHKSHVVRQRIVNKLKTALALVVTRGADTDRDGDTAKIVFRDADSGEDKWLCKEWTYAAFPSLELYRMPLTEIIPHMRSALVAVKARADMLSSGWLHKAPREKQHAAELQKRKGREGREFSQHHKPPQRKQYIVGTVLAIDRHKLPAPELDLNPEEAKQEKSPSWFMYDDDSASKIEEPSPARDAPVQCYQAAQGSHLPSEGPSVVEPAVAPRGNTTLDPFFPSRFNHSPTGKSPLSALLSRLEEFDKADQKAAPAPSVSKTSAAAPAQTGPPAFSKPTFTSKLRPFGAPEPAPQQEPETAKSQEPETTKSRIAARLFRNKAVIKRPTQGLGVANMKKRK